MKKYKCVIRKDIPKDYFDIINVELYSGKTVVLEKYSEERYLGKLPKSNIKRDWWWTTSCFSSIAEIT